MSNQLLLLNRSIYFNIFEFFECYCHVSAESRNCEAVALERLCKQMCCYASRWEGHAALIGKQESLAEMWLISLIICCKSINY
jgi:hypothetical protein